MLELHAAAAFKSREHKIQCFLLNIQHEVICLLYELGIHLRIQKYKSHPLKVRNFESSDTTDQLFQQSSPRLFQEPLVTNFASTLISLFHIPTSTSLSLMHKLCMGQDYMHPNQLLLTAARQCQRMNARQSVE